MFITAREFAKEVGESYGLVLNLCKEGKIECEKTDGGHFKVYKSEIEKYKGKKQDDFITREDYEAVVRENEKLKCIIEQTKALLTI